MRDSTRKACSKVCAETPVSWCWTQETGALGEALIVYGLSILTISSVFHLSEMTALTINFSMPVYVETMLSDMVFVGATPQGKA